MRCGLVAPTPIAACQKPTWRMRVSTGIMVARDAPKRRYSQVRRAGVKVQHQGLAADFDGGQVLGIVVVRRRRDVAGLSGGGGGSNVLGYGPPVFVESSAQGDGPVGSGVGSLDTVDLEGNAFSLRLGWCGRDGGQREGGKRHGRLEMHVD